MSRKNTPPAYGDPAGPMMEDTHSYRLSPLGPPSSWLGGSNEISANSSDALRRRAHRTTLRHGRVGATATLRARVASARTVAGNGGVRRGAHVAVALTRRCRLET